MPDIGSSLQSAGAVASFIPGGQLIGVGLGVAGGIAKILGGKSDYEKNKQKLDQLKDPFYKIQDEYFQNRNIAANDAETGLSPQANDYYTTESQRGLGSSLNAVTQGGGSPNAVSQILDTYNRGIRQTAVQGEQLRMQKLNTFLSKNNDEAGQRTIQWNLNEYQPNLNKRALYSGNMTAAKQNQTQGWNDILGGISAASTSFMNAGGVNGASSAPASSSMYGVNTSTVSPYSRDYLPAPTLTTGNTMRIN